jgi:hypothetical protein
MVRTCSTTGEKKRAYRTLVEKSEGKDRLEHLGVDVSIIIKGLQKNQNGRM